MNLYIRYKICTANCPYLKWGMKFICRGKGEVGNGFPHNLVHGQAAMTLEISKYVDDLLIKHWLRVVKGWAHGNMPD